ncbi:hypothetical protein ESCO_002920 [Escovopsis weberi]|uniref:Rhodopsin domain-containing protein n=1 Tax=Escovopsis weberi TaxID=150374 RepID=A0A0M8N1G9_ESCWE|nr:hypothetical protein ESCO_002920 [Escovopsis weberi]
MIVSRLIGRFLRTEKLFPEDKVAAFALIPLFLRMGCVDFILKEGTNNASFDNVVLSASEVHRKAIASGLVLVSRALYAATLWLLKATILEFLRRLTDLTWERSYHTTSVAIRWTLVVTFLAVIVSDLVECRPFRHYWQVLPDPGGQCRQGYVQLITMATCNVLTDLMLVIFPVSIIIRSKMTPCRKIQLVLLFSLSLSVVCVTLFRVVRVIDRHGSQQYRSLLASVELIFATASANALIIASFIRDRGVKKKKFRRRSTPISYEPPMTAHRSRRPTIRRHWGSDEDLVRDIGLGIDPQTREHSEALSQGLFRKAPVFTPLSTTDLHRQREVGPIWIPYRNPGKSTH